MHKYYIMKISEIAQLTERISLTQYHTPVLQAIRDGILETVYEMREDFGTEDFEPLRNINPVTIEGSYWETFSSILRGYFEIHLKRHLEDKLSKASRNIVGVGSPGKWVNVVFKDTKTNSGWAEWDNTVGLSETYYFDKLIADLIENLSNIISDNAEGKDTVTEILDKFILRLPKDTHLQAVLIMGGGRGDIKFLNDLASTVLHELVHVKQHMEQHKLGKNRTQYRSYLQKSKEEFAKAQKKENSSDWIRLHASSPQEIGAYINNIATQIIVDYGFDDATSTFELSPVEADSMMYYVRDFLVNRIGTPKTAKEKMIFKRYLKGVYQEVMSYRQKVLTKIKQRERQQDAEYRDVPLPTPEPGLKGNIKSRMGTHTRPALPRE